MKDRIGLDVKGFSGEEKGGVGNELKKKQERKKAASANPPETDRLVLGIEDGDAPAGRNICNDF